MFFFFFQAEDGIRDFHVTGVQTCALPISRYRPQGGAVVPASERGRPSSSRATSSGRLSSIVPTSVRTMWRRNELAVISNASTRSEEHTSELQSRENLVCRLLL